MIENKSKRSPDFIIFIVVLILLSIGIIMVFSSSAYSSFLTHGTPYYYLKRQLINTLVGIVAMLVAMNFHFKMLYRFANPILLVSMVLLVLVIIMGIAGGGASRWLGIGPFVFQPSEVTKLAVVIFMAKTLSVNQKKLRFFIKGLLPQLAILGLVCALILAQPDLGTAVAVAGTVYFLLAVAGARLLHLWVLAVTGLAAVSTAIMTAEYRMRRILAFLNPYDDPTGYGFQTIQSLLALGSGGLFGMGLGNGRQKLLYIPERHTDFIYAIIGEELGFIGAAFLLLLFAVFMWRGFKVAVSAPDDFSSLLAAGITIMITLQALINIGVVTGSLPVTGITLPFISYGGSSLVFTLTGVGILLNISRYTRSG
ncbi:MAG: putative lipid II flippase FtsW [Bacillota bacterium]